MRLQIIACIMSASLLFGCSGPVSPEVPKAGASPAQSFSHVIATEVEYYKIGPQQGRPPDGKFPAGTKVNIIRQAGSYTQVRSEGGVEATVASDAIKELGTDGAAAHVRGLVFVSMVALLAAPVLHRIMHSLHLEADDHGL